MNIVARTVVEAMYAPIDDLRTTRRSICEFAEQEVYLPEDSARRAGQRYSYAFMPFKRLVHAELRNPRWRRRFISGPSQVGGKTLDMIIAMMHGIFELRRPAFLAGPDVDMVQTVVWEPKIKPVIMASRYRDLLPSRGQGSRGGKARALRFRNGVPLFFVGAGGSDSQRISLTVQDGYLTELDEFDRMSEAALESPAKALEDRLQAYSDWSLLGEGVVHHKGSLVWREMECSLDGRPTGSGGRIQIQCPHCLRWIWPDREHLTGWQDAETELAARAAAAYACPDCGAAWSEADRARACLAPRLVHRGQQVDDRGVVTGELPETHTLGIRWNCMHSPMVSLAEIAAREWKAQRQDTDAEQRNVCNNLWNEPWSPEAAGASSEGGLSANFIREKTNRFAQGLVPTAAKRLTQGIDVGKYLCSWMLPAWDLDATSWLVQSGEVAAAEGEMSPELAIRSALARFLDQTFTVGWEQEGGGQPRIPDLVLIDSGWWPKVIYALCREFKARGFNVLPSKGYGSTNRRSPFRAPRQNDDTHQVGNEWFLSYLEEERLWLANINADYWKRFVHARLLTPQADEKGNPVPGSLTLWTPSTDGQGRVNRMEHQTNAKALVSEVWEERFDPKRGLVSGWKIQNRSIHRLDAMALAAAAADMCGVKVLPVERSPEHRRPTSVGRPQRSIRARY